MTSQGGTETPRRLHVNALHKALVDAGVVRGDEAIRRIVIDADIRNIGVMMYIERWADERTLQIATALDGIDIRMVADVADESVS